MGGARARTSVSMHFMILGNDSSNLRRFLNENWHDYLIHDFVKQNIIYLKLKINDRCSGMANRTKRVFPLKSS